MVYIFYFPVHTQKVCIENIESEIFILLFIWIIIQINTRPKLIPRDTYLPFLFLKYAYYCGKILRQYCLFQQLNFNSIQYHNLCTLFIVY